jgi:hypothetical protein
MSRPQPVFAVTTASAIRKRRPRHFNPSTLEFVACVMRYLAGRASFLKKTYTELVQSSGHSDLAEPGRLADQFMEQRRVQATAPPKDLPKVG